MKDPGTKNIDNMGPWLLIYIKELEIIQRSFIVTLNPKELVIFSMDESIPDKAYVFNTETKSIT